MKSTLALTLALALAAASAAFADTIIIDSFTAGNSFTLTNSNGTASHNYITGASTNEIIGGSRQVRVRAASSGFFGSSNIAINTTAGTLTSFGGDGNERFVQYGSAIGSQTFTGAGTDAPVDLNLNLSLADTIHFEVTSLGSPATVQLSILSNGESYQSPYFGINIPSTGSYSFSLGQISGFTEVLADDVDGFQFNFPMTAATAGAGITVSNLRLETAAIPEPSSFAALAGLASLGWVASRRRRA